VAVEIKFCGMTRAADAQYAASLGAAYVGVIFAKSPRRVEPAAAAAVLAGVRERASTVGVFGHATVETIGTVASDLGLDVVQLHGDPTPDVVERMRPRFDGAVWAAIRIDGSTLPDHAAGLLAVADAVVLDARVGGQLGGTGHSFDWGAIARALEHRRDHARVVLAGGLSPENVARAVRTIVPDVVDVSSGVESAPGIKDHARMRDFRDAVRRRGDTLSE
jgi:phosphoribosylanthranilate isomerase